MVNGLVIAHKVGEVEIGQRVSDGYVNATAMCKARGRLLGNYLRNDTTQEYLEALSADMRIRISDLVQVRKGGNPDQQGTWVHPDIAVHLGQWCDPVFAVLVNRWMREWLTMDGRQPHARFTQSDCHFPGKCA
jgi:hypothetical protein